MHIAQVIDSSDKSHAIFFLVLIHKHEYSRF